MGTWTTQDASDTAPSNGWDEYPDKPNVQTMTEKVPP